MSEKAAATNAMEMKMEQKAKAKAETVESAKKETTETKKTRAFTFDLEDFGVIKFPLMTEKAISLIEKENKIAFVVHENATKSDIKRLVEKVYHVKVEKLNVVNDMKGRKKVTVKLDKKFKAEELAAKLGVI